MKTEEILNEREKTHGDFKTASETHYKAKELFRAPMQKNGVPLYRIEAIEAIIAKINRIAHGNHDHADHWDDIAGYAMLGKGRDDVKKESFEEQLKRCPHSPFSREHLSVSDNDKNFRTTCYFWKCHDCGHLHVADIKQEKIIKSEDSASSKMEHVVKCDRCGQECETTCCILRDIDLNKRFCPKCTGHIAGEACRKEREERESI